MHEWEVGSDQSQEHDDEEDATGELHVILWLVVAESGHAREQALRFGFVFDKQEKKTAS